MGDSLISVDDITSRILLIRGQRVMLDVDLAELYGTTTGALNQAVKRNVDRFPPDFMYRLTGSEKKEVITICDNLGKIKYYPRLPYAFTEHGAIMVASVLNTSRAVQISVYVVRAFVSLRQFLATNKELGRKFADLEQRVGTHDREIQSLIQAIRQLMAPPLSKNRKIGFVREG